jgi:hypothetical protein
MTGDQFRTFCHIDDYGVGGFAELHRMIAVSKPLVLWGPSSQLLLDASCRVGGREFLEYVDGGQIRIVGRHRWILSKTFRNGHPWPGARWNSQIDERIRDIALEDEGLALHDRRVVLADDARGTDWAERYIAEHPAAVDQIHRALTGAESRNHFPIQVIDSANRSGHEPRPVARTVLAHVYNHSDAIALSGADTPFLLQPRESRFLRLLGEVRAVETFPYPPLRQTPHAQLSPGDLAHVTRQVMDLLQALEAAGSTKLSKFVAHDGHTLLATWTSELCRSLAEENAARVDGAALRTLQREFEAGELSDGWSDVFLGRESMVASMGTSAGLIEAAVTSQLSILGAIGIAAGAYDVGHSLLQKFGYANVDYSESQWPFLYTFGGKATRRRKTILGRVLDSLTSAS